VKITSQSLQANVIVHHTKDSKLLFCPFELHPRKLDGHAYSDLQVKEAEPSMQGFIELVKSGNYTMDVVPNWSQPNALPTLIITEKEQ
jgi:hypothetical protein